MAWVLTIHKSQGLTLHKATIDIGKIKRQGLTFTTISRVRSLKDLHIQLVFSLKRFSKMENNPCTIIRKGEETQLHQIALSTIKVYNIFIESCSHYEIHVQSRSSQYSKIIMFLLMKSNYLYTGPQLNISRT